VSDIATVEEGANDCAILRTECDLQALTIACGGRLWSWCPHLRALLAEEVVVECREWGGPMFNIQGRPAEVLPGHGEVTSAIVNFDSAAIRELFLIADESMGKFGKTENMNACARRRNLRVAIEAFDNLLRPRCDRPRRGIPAAVEIDATEAIAEDNPNAVVTIEVGERRVVRAPCIGVAGVRTPLLRVRDEGRFRCLAPPRWLFEAPSHPPRRCAEALPAAAGVCQLWSPHSGASCPALLPIRMTFYLTSNACKAILMTDNRAFGHL
jgi:hypothetical protein